MCYASGQHQTARVGPGWKYGRRCDGICHWYTPRLFLGHIARVYPGKLAIYPHVIPSYTRDKFIPGIYIYSWLVPGQYSRLVRRTDGENTAGILAESRQFHVLRILGGGNGGGFASLGHPEFVAGQGGTANQQDTIVAAGENWSLNNVKTTKSV